MRSSQPKGLRWSWLGTVAALLFAFAAPRARTEAPTLEPSMGDAGTTIHVGGLSGLTARPRIALRPVNGGRAAKAKLVHFSETGVDVELRAATPGTYQLLYGPRSSRADLLGAGTFEVRAPEFDPGSAETDPPMAVAPAQTVTLRGSFFGSRAGQVQIGFVRAPVTEWASDHITYLVPGSVPWGTSRVRIRSHNGATFARSVTFLPEDTVLPVQFSPQRTQVWCWAACEEMLFRYYGYPVDQCQIVSYWCGANACLSPQLCLFTATIPNMRLAFAVGGLRSKAAFGAMTFDSLAREIAVRRRPVIAAYTNSFSGHVVVIYGWHRDGSVDIHDPYYGTFHVPYGATFVYSGSLVWSDTITGIRR